MALALVMTALAVAACSDDGRDDDTATGGDSAEATVVPAADFGSAGAAVAAVVGIPLLRWRRRSRPATA